LTNLTWLSLKDTEIRDISPLNELISLKHLSLTWVPYDNSQLEELLAVLPDCTLGID